ncbi:hypothetical protein VTN31DRAFT_3979 [Thermomyces dupontii]|uniref:uncharacterized protein n=1 Tax=Talaromyces thermophilus TaxID=28565 RepID=UPI003743B89A
MVSKSPGPISRPQSSIGVRPHRPSSSTHTPRSATTPHLQEQEPQKSTTAGADSAAPAPVPFPSPQIFDFLPPLHAILSRLLASSSSVPASGGTQNQEPGNQTSGQSDSQKQIPPQTSSSTGPTSTPTAAAGAASTTAGAAPSQSSQQLPAPQQQSAPLDLKELPTATNAIRIRIQKARAVVEALPDVHRSVAEQEEEIRALEERIEKLKGVIADFGRRVDSAA